MGRSVYFIGPRASGKTTLARMVAQRTGRSFADTDRLVVARAGKPIADLVAERGWDAFRDMEEDAVRYACNRDGMSVATGGGVILREASREALGQAGLVVWLYGPAELFCSRLAADPIESQRPALTDMDPEAEMRAVLEEREPLYRECAHVALDASLPVDDLCAAVVELLDKADELALRGDCLLDSDAFECLDLDDEAE